MSKELPYFRFTCQEWDSGDISLENHSTKGLFIDICSYYWLQNCDLTLAKLSKKVRKMTQKSQRKARERLDVLAKSGIIKIDGDSVRIDFLDSQLQELVEKSNKLSEAGKKGVEAREKKKQATLKPGLSNKDKDKDKDKDPSTKRKKNPIWDYLCELFQLNPVTVQERKELGRIVSDFKKKEATPERIKKIHDEFKRVWPKASCTHRALLKHYDYLKNSIVNGSDDDGYGDIKRI